MARAFPARALPAIVGSGFVCRAAAAHAHVAALDPTATSGLFSSTADTVAAALIATLLAISTGLYGVGVSRLWHAAAPGRGIRRAEVAAFALGSATLAVSLLGPLDRWTSQSFAAHMLQHEALMLIAAPLLVCGRPLAAWSWALSCRGKARAAAFIRWPVWRALWRWITRPSGATTLQLVALFAWHVPRAFDYAATHAGAHALQHLSFLATALCFWWATRSSDGVHAHVGGAGSGVALACLFATMIATGALGALMTFAPAPWYHGYAGGLPWASSALEDQQLGGLLMWVPGGAVYFVAGLRRAWWLLVRAAPDPAPRMAPAPEGMSP